MFDIYLYVCLWRIWGQMAAVQIRQTQNTFLRKKHFWGWRWLIYVMHSHDDICSIFGGNEQVAFLPNKHGICYANTTERTITFMSFMEKHGNYYAIIFYYVLFCSGLYLKLRWQIVLIINRESFPLLICNGCQWVGPSCGDIFRWLFANAIVIDSNQIWNFEGFFYLDHQKMILFLKNFEHSSCIRRKWALSTTT